MLEQNSSLTYREYDDSEKEETIKELVWCFDTTEHDLDNAIVTKNHAADLVKRLEQYVANAQRHGCDLTLVPNYVERATRIRVKVADIFITDTLDWAAMCLKAKTNRQSEALNKIEEAQKYMKEFEDVLSPDKVAEYNAQIDKLTT